MRKPWFRESCLTWYIEIDGKQKSLGKDPDGAKRKTPPPHIENAWHKLIREGEPKDMRLSDVFEKYKEASGENPTNYMLDHFQRHAGEIKMSKLKPLHLTAFLNTKPNWAPSSVRTCVNRVHSAINWAVREGYITENPISKVPGYKRQGRIEQRKMTMTPDDRRKIEAAGHPCFRDFLAALRESGCRPSEIRRVQIEKCDLTAGVMRVPNKTANKTGEAERVVFLSETMIEILKRRIGQRTTGHVFMTPRGKTWTHDNIESHWDRARKKSGVKGQMYEFRHAFASDAINEKNVNPALVAQLMGHSDLKMLLRHYLHKDPEALKRAIKEITGPQSEETQ